MFAPVFAGDFDGDVWVSFALANEPFLLLGCEGVALAEVLTGFRGEAGEAVFLIGVPPVFEGARGIATAVVVGPRFGGGASECVCECEAFFETLGEVRDGAVADESALFLWGDGFVWHAGGLVPRRHLRKCWVMCDGSFWEWCRVSLV